MDGDGSSMVILYSEIVHARKDGRVRALYWREIEGQFSDLVLVEVRKWSRPAFCGAGDIIIEERVLVDSEIIINKCICYNDMSESEVLRRAIKSFDLHLAAHPTLGGQQ